MAGSTFNVTYDGISVLLLIKTKAGEAAKVAAELARVTEQDGEVAGRVWGVLWAAVVDTDMSSRVADMLEEGDMLSEIGRGVIANVDVIASLRAESKDDLRKRWLPKIRKVQASPDGVETATPLAISQYRPHNGH